VKEVNPVVRKILFLTFSTPAGDPALAHAAGLARESGSTLLIVQVEQPQQNVDAITQNGDPLATEPSAWTLPADISCEVQQIRADELVSVAGADDVELIIIGAHGRDGLRKLLNVTPAAETPVMCGGPPTQEPSAPAHDQSSLHEVLTPREIEVLVYLAQGLSVKECARVMKRSPSTIDNHKTRLMRKLNIHRVVDLARLAVREKLIAS